MYCSTICSRETQFQTVVKTTKTKKKITRTKKATKMPRVSRGEMPGVFLEASCLRLWTTEAFQPLFASYCILLHRIAWYCCIVVDGSFAPHLFVPSPPHLAVHHHVFPAAERLFIHLYFLLHYGCLYACHLLHCARFAREN